MPGMWSGASVIFSTRWTPRKILSVSVPEEIWWTVPGQSMRYIFLVSVTYCHTFVSPGIGADLQAFLPLSVLMTEDLPTLGYPTKPTQVTCFLLLKRESCLSKEKRAPFPKGFVTLAWKASVGYSFERNWTHFLVTDAGICRGRSIASQQTMQENPDLWAVLRFSPLSTCMHTRWTLDKTVKGQAQSTHWTSKSQRLSSIRRNTYQITLIQEEHNMFLLSDFWHFFLQMLTPRTHRVSCIQNLNEYIRTIDHLEQFWPDSFGLPLLHATWDIISPMAIVFHFSCLEIHFTLTVGGQRDSAFKLLQYVSR